MRHLVHDTGLAITVSVGLWVELVLEGWLGGVGVCGGGSGEASAGGASGASGVAAGVSASGVAESTTNGARLALESVVALLTSGKDTTLLLVV